MKRQHQITFTYIGSKSRLAPHLVKLMPETGDTYFEPFAGRGNMFFVSAKVLRFNHWLLNDIQTADFFRQIKSSAPGITIPQTPKERRDKQQDGLELSQRHFHEWEDEDIMIDILAEELRTGRLQRVPGGGFELPCDPQLTRAIKRGRHPYFRLPGDQRPRRKQVSELAKCDYAHMKLLESYTTFNGEGYRKGPDTSTKHKTPHGFQETLLDAHRILNSLNVTIKNWDWKRFAEFKIRWDPQDFAYIDPPYLVVTHKPMMPRTSTTPV